ncbi:molybdenum cofactor guanylyltransferase [Pannus brasiliensis CCIBt3594]|uniref:Probable molybdenum cofactor guanylyltransferase n=1 Tax=Pannus brasiliensis CCIBt3594 TaxID=1427578 RepID=A0AAW9QII4_9CHRO
MESLPSFSAIVLAGGQSSRMGRDKALLPVRGVPLLRRICTLAAERATTVYVVTGHGDAHELIVPEPCRIIREPPPARGPLFAFSLVLPLVETEWVLLLACDLPLLTADSVREWSEILPDVPEEAIALVPYLDRHWEPLCGFYRRRCLAGLRKFIATGGNSFQQWLNASPVHELPVANPRVLFNCNTPADLEVIIHAPDKRPDEKHHERDKN